jgi:ABC-type phosphate/phosphonate transport system substrate-binding protein
LEDKLSAQFRRPVAIDMKVLRDSNGGEQLLESTNAMFGRMGPVNYTFALDRSNGVSLLAMQDYEKPLTMVLVTRKDSEIARLLDSRTNITFAELLSGRSVAFSGTNSTTGSLMAKWFLAKEGVYAASLARYEHLGGQRRVFDAVLAGSFDVGAGNIENLDEYPDLRDLRVIVTKQIPGLGRCWVAGNGLKEETEQAIRECLLQLKSKRILGGLESKTEGFTDMKPAAHKRLREVINGATAFDNPSPGHSKTNP